MRFVYIPRLRDAHGRSGQQVRVVGEAEGSVSHTGDLSKLFLIQFEDGYSCNAFADELILDDVTEPNFDKMEYEKQDGEYGAFFFGNVCIRAIRTEAGRYTQLTPVSGDRVACGEWFDLTYSEVCHYCSLIERQLNKDREV